MDDGRVGWVRVTNFKVNMANFVLRGRDVPHGRRLQWQQYNPTLIPDTKRTHLSLFLKPTTAYQIFFY